MENKTKLFLIIAAVAAISQLSTDIYVPAVPTIAKNFNANINLIQTSVSIYLFGIAASLLIYGALSEKIGRKKTLLIGLLIIAIGTIVCMLSQGPKSLIIGRLLQGLGAGAPAGLWRVLFFDLCKEDDFIKWGSYLTTLFTFILPAAPILGSGLLGWMGWPSIFAFIAIYCLLVSYILYAHFDETHKKQKEPQKTAPTNACSPLKNYTACLSNPAFLGISICTFMTYGAFFSWFVISPVLVIKHMGVSPMHYSFLNFFSACIMTSLGSWFNAKYASAIGAKKTLILGWSFMIFAGILMSAGFVLFGNSLFVLFIPMLFFFFGGTLIWPTASLEAMKNFPNKAGYAGSMYAFMQQGGGALIGTLLAHIHHDEDPLALAACFIASSLLALIIYTLMVLPQEKSNIKTSS